MFFVDSKPINNQSKMEMKSIWRTWCLKPELTIPRSTNLKDPLVSTVTRRQLIQKELRDQGNQLKVSLTLINAFKMSEKIGRRKETSLLHSLLIKSERNRNVSDYSKKNMSEINHLHLSYISSSMMQSMSLISLGSFLSEISSI